MDELLMILVGAAVLGLVTKKEEPPVTIVPEKFDFTGGSGSVDTNEPGITSPTGHDGTGLVAEPPAANETAPNVSSNIFNPESEQDKPAETSTMVIIPRCTANDIDRIMAASGNINNTSNTMKIDGSSTNGATIAIYVRILVEMSAYDIAAVLYQAGLGDIIPRAQYKPSGSPIPYSEYQADTVMPDSQTAVEAIKAYETPSSTVDTILRTEAGSVGSGPEVTEGVASRRALLSVADGKQQIRQVLNNLVSMKVISSVPGWNTPYMNAVNALDGVNGSEQSYATFADYFQILSDATGIPMYVQQSVYNIVTSMPHG